MKNRNFEDTKITFKQNGNGRVDYVVSKDCQFMGVQLFHFVPYAYEPFSEIYYYTDADAKAFQNYLEINKILIFCDSLCYDRGRLSVKSRLPLLFKTLM